MLRVQVSRLRKALGDAEATAEPRLQARPPGYLLHVADGELDLHGFEQQVAAGRQALADGDPARAAATAAGSRVAVARPPARRPGVRALRPVGGRSASKRSGSRLSRTGSRRSWRSGGTPPLCPELEQLVAEHPLRERLRGQLMLALYRCGRQADALETYRAGRSLLVEELAVEPGPQLRKLQRAILGQDPALDLPPRRAQAAQRASPASRPGVPAAASDGPAARPGPARTAAPPAPPPDPPVAGARRRPPRWPRSRLRAAVPPRDRRMTPLNANLLALVSPSNGAVQATVPLQAPPSRRNGGQLVRCGSPSRALAWWSASTRRVARSPPTIPVGTRPSRVVAAGDQVWVLDPADRTLARIDPQDRHGGADDRPGRPAERRPAQRGIACGSPARTPGRCCGSTPAPAAP